MLGQKQGAFLKPSTISSVKTDAGGVVEPENER